MNLDLEELQPGDSQQFPRVDSSSWRRAAREVDAAHRRCAVPLSGVRLRVHRRRRRRGDGDGATTSTIPPRTPGPLPRASVAQESSTSAAALAGRPRRRGARQLRLRLDIVRHETAGRRPVVPRRDGPGACGRCGAGVRAGARERALQLPRPQRRPARRLVSGRARDVEPGARVAPAPGDAPGLVAARDRGRNAVVVLGQ